MRLPPFVDPPSSVDVAQARKARRDEFQKARDYGLRVRQSVRLARAMRRAEAYRQDSQRSGE